MLSQKAYCFHVLDYINIKQEPWKYSGDTRSPWSHHSTVCYLCSMAQKRKL